MKRFRWSTLTVMVIMLTFLSSVAMFGVISQRIFHLVSGVEYMDKTFVYSIKDLQSGDFTKVMCAEKDAPTYDVKKGLMTWVDYKSYELEEIFSDNVSRHIRAILKEAGPEKDKETVVNRLKETLGIVDLTYDEVISAMQYAIWYYSDNDFRIPSTSNGEDLYKYFVSLEGVSSTSQTDFVTVVVDSVKRDTQHNKIIIEYHYSGNNKATLTASYSKNIRSEYNATESINTHGDTTNVTIEIPISANEMNIDFDIFVEGTIKESKEYAAFVPEVRGSSQILVGYLTQNNVISADLKKAHVSYQAYELTLNDDGDVVKKGFTEGTVVTMSMINTLNPTGKDGFVFEGWYEGQKKITTQVVMDKNRYLDAKYSTDSNGGGTPGTGDNPGGGTPGTGDNPGGGTPGTGDNPGGGTPGIGDDPTGGDTPTIGKEPEEPLFDDPIPEDVPSLITTLTKWPNTGGTPLLVFMVCGSLSVSAGILLRRSK